jgi:hypothetical protein
MIHKSKPPPKLSDSENEIKKKTASRCPRIGNGAAHKLAEEMKREAGNKERGDPVLTAMASARCRDLEP